MLIRIKVLCKRFRFFLLRADLVVNLTAPDRHHAILFHFCQKNLIIRIGVSMAKSSKNLHNVFNKSNAQSTKERLIQKSIDTKKLL